MRIFLLFLILSFSPLTYAQSPQVPVEIFGQLENKSMFAISPSGKYLAYRDTSDGRDLAVIVNKSDFSFVDGVDISKVNPSNLYFVDEDKLILVVRKTQTLLGYQGRHRISYAFVYNLGTKKLFQMLVGGKHGLTSGQTNLGSIVGISENKKHAFMPAFDDNNNYNLYKKSLNKKGRPSLYKRGSNSVIDYFLGVNDEVIARELYYQNSQKHVIESYLSGEWKVVFSEETPYITKGFNGITPDKKSLVMSVTDKNGFRSYYALSLIDGSLTEKLFSQEGKGVETTITNINRVVYGVEYSGFKPSYEFFDEKLNARIKGLNRALPQYTTRIVDYTNDWDNIIFYTTGADLPGGFLMYENGSVALLTMARADMPANAVSVVKEYQYKARDGLLIPTLLTYPNNKETKNLPAIMLPHGGPESYDKLGYDYLAQYFANRGYLVIQPQFRGSSGFGAQHTLKGYGQWGLQMQDDLTDGVLHLAETGLIDPNKVCIVGASYGGYAAMAGAVFTPEQYKCVISINGVADLPFMMRSERQAYGSNHWVISYWDTIISGGEFDKDHLSTISPINFVEKVNAPILFIHGKYDKVLQFKQSERMYDE